MNLHEIANSNWTREITSCKERDQRTGVRSHKKEKRKVKEKGGKKEKKITITDNTQVPHPADNACQ